MGRIFPTAASGAAQQPERLWRTAEPRRSYRVVIVGGGAHGLATAYYLARNHGITDVAVLDRGWLAGGNATRTTAIVRSQHLPEARIGVYEHALKLWEHLEQELDYPILLSQRGALTLAHTPQQVRDGVRRVQANRLAGVDAEWLSPVEAGKAVPILNTSPTQRYPVLGAALQPRAGIAKHDHVAWGFARGAADLGVHIVEHCEVTGFDRAADGRITGVRTSRGDISAQTVALCAAGHTGVLTDMAGIAVPVETRALQAFVSELLEPILPAVVLSDELPVTVSQAHKGELVLGAGPDSYPSYRPGGAAHAVERQIAAALELFPVFAHAHVLRTWAGLIDVTPDNSPIIGATGTEGLMINCGWGTGGFAATPGIGWCYAYTIAQGEPHPLIAAFGLDRFVTGALVGR